MASIDNISNDTLTTLRLLGAIVTAKRVLAADLRQRIDAIKQQVLDAGEFMDEYDGTRVTEPSKDWHINEDQCGEYYKQIADAQIAAGFDPEPIREGFCPALVVASALRDAENDLVEAARAIPGCEHVTTNRLLATFNEDGDGLTNRKRYVDLLVKLTA